MSAPACAWAIEQGRALKLAPLERWVLVALAERANGQLVCWPSQHTIALDTGLSLRKVRDCVHRLATSGLIRLEEAVGKVTRYHVLRPTEPRQDVPGSRPNGRDDLSTTPAPAAGVTPAPHAATPAPHAGDPGTACRRTLKEPSKEPEEARAGATVPATSPLPPCGAGEAAPSRRQEEAPPPVVGSNDPVDPAAVRGLVAGVTSSLRSAAPPRPAPLPEPYVPIHRGPVDPIRTPEEQAAILRAWIAEEALAKAGRVLVAAE